MFVWNPEYHRLLLTLSTAKYQALITMTFPNRQILQVLETTLRALETTLSSDVATFAQEPTNRNVEDRLRERIVRHFYSLYNRNLYLREVENEYREICRAGPIVMGPYMFAVYNIAKMPLQEDLPIPWEDVKKLDLQPDRLPNTRDVDVAGEQVRAAKRKQVPNQAEDGPSPDMGESRRVKSQSQATVAKVCTALEQPQWATIEQDIIGQSEGKELGRAGRAKVKFKNIGQGKRKATEEVDELDNSDERSDRRDLDDDDDDDDELSDGVLRQQCDQCLKAGHSARRRTPAPCLKEGGFKVCDRCHVVKSACSLFPRLSKYREHQQREASGSPPAIRGRAPPPAQRNSTSRQMNHQSSKDGPTFRAISQRQTRSQSRSLREQSISRTQSRADSSDDETSGSGEYHSGDLSRVNIGR